MKSKVSIKLNYILFLIAFLFFMFGGEPDIQDAIIKYLMRGQ